MVRESYERGDGIVRRTLVIAGREFRSWIEDRSGEGEDASAWRRWWRSYLAGMRSRAESPSAEIAIADVFCGCGGLSLGAVEAAVAVGLRPRISFAVDMDSEALAVYAANLGPSRTVHANVDGLVDYRIVGWGGDARFAYEPEPVHSVLQENRGRVDLLIGGPPCEGHSNLNNRTRRDDPRNLLYLDAVAAAVAVGARAVVLENVPEIVHDRHGVLRTAVALLERAGYATTRGVLAADRLGWPQTRRRYFLVGSRYGVIGLARIVSALSRPAADLRWAIGDLVHRQDETPMDIVPAYSEKNRSRIDYLFDNDLYELPDSLRPLCQSEGHTYRAVYGRLRWDRPAGTITSGFWSPGRGRYVHPAVRRTLTAREAVRLQGLPDSYEFCPGGRVPSRSALAKWIGDAVPPILGYAAALAAMPGLAAGREA